MIIQMDYEDNGLYAIKTNYNKKEKYHYIRYVVDEFSIDRAIEDIKGNKYVVALDYEGDIQYLNSLKERPENIPVIVTKELRDVNELSIAFLMQKLPNWVVVAIKTPEDFCDMRVVENLSNKFKNIRFCGGKFLRLPSCNIGCILRENIPEKIPESKINFYTEKCSCIISTMHIDEVQGLEYIYKKNVKSAEDIKPVIQQDSKKKAIDSMADILNL